MCRRVECSKCHRPTFAGCGMHIEQVLGDVPREQRCHCNEKSAVAKPKSAPTSASWFERLLGK